MAYASRSKRVLGQIIDWFFAALPLILFSAANTGHEVGTFDLFGLAAILWFLFYYFLADGFANGQSWGKRILGMRVVREDGVTSCSFGRSFVRNLLLNVLGPIDWIFIFGERRQRLGDKLAGTIVIVA